MKDSESSVVVDETAKTEQMVETPSVETDPLDEKLMAQTDESLFELYVENNLPSRLRGAAAEGSVELAEERQDHRSKWRAIWNAKLARGFTPRELSLLDPMPEVRMLPDTPVRPPPSTVGREVEAEARRALHELDARGLKLFVSLQVALQQASRGVYNSAVTTLKGAITAAGAAVRAYDLERQRSSEEKAARVTVRVLATAGPGRKYTPGSYQLTLEEVEELQTWATRVESNARGRSLSSLGYGTWPAFTLES
jgi:hypothetical protein